MDLAGGTGAWSVPYKKADYSVKIITLPDNDVTTYIPPANVYGILAAPPCTEFSYAKSKSKSLRNMQKGMETVIACLRIVWKVQYRLPTPLARKTILKFWALENPYGLLRYFLGKPALVFNPYDYGDQYQKKTCLWGFFNEPKKNPVILSKEEKVKFGTNSSPLKKFPEGYKLPSDMDKRAVRRAITSEKFTEAFFESNK